MTKFTKEVIKEAHTQLKSMLKPGDTIHCVLRHVSRSRMSRRISFFVNHTNGKKNQATLYCIDQLIARICSYNIHPKYEGLVVRGCEDIGSAVVYNLSRSLFPKGFKLPKGAYGRNGDTSGYDNNGGYALKHNWL